MDVIAPLRMTRAGVSAPVGAVLLSINPDGFLYPFIQAWPVPSRSAETLLVEREGDHVLYLNELRHQNNTALNLTIPLTQTDVPAVKAVLGTTGAFTGKDYRGVDVISSLGPVPGSPWYIVAKVDTAEAYSSWQSFSALIIVLVAITLGGAVIIVGLFWQRRQKSYYRSLYSAEAERGPLKNTGTARGWSPCCILRRWSLRVRGSLWTLSLMPDAGSRKARWHSLAGCPWMKGSLRARPGRSL
jgi:hypothetical protein